MTVLSVMYFFVGEFAPLFFVPFLVDLPEAEKLALSLCCYKDRPSVWKTVYFECLSSGKHFLEQVLVSVPGLLETVNTDLNVRFECVCSNFLLTRFNFYKK